MGGQACVFYGAAEFSRDIDFAILADGRNLVRLRRALSELQAEPIAVPPFQLKHLRRGHALHFRCQHPEAPRMRVDVMSKMRGVESFAKLWRRRTTLTLPDRTPCELLSLPDLVQAKKTQRDKDWPMVRRLVEAHYFEHRQRPKKAQIDFWLRELRTSELLTELAASYPRHTRRLTTSRPILAAALAGKTQAVESGLAVEERQERQRDRAHWLPLRDELEAMRRDRLVSGSRKG